MEENHPIEKLMLTAMSSIKDMIDVNTIIGEPIKALDNTVIIPISKVGFGFAAGGSEFNDETINSYNKKDKEESIKYRLPFGGGSGAGVNISPVAFLIIQNDNVKLLEATHASVLDKLVEYIPDAIDKVHQIIKRKMDKDEDVFIEDDFDDDIEDDFDDDFEDDNFEDDNFEDDADETSSKDTSKYDFEQDDDWFDSEEDLKDEKSSKSEKKTNQIVNKNQGKAKKLEEKINEIKNSK